MKKNANVRAVSRIVMHWNMFHEAKLKKDVVTKSM